MRVSRSLSHRGGAVAAALVAAAFASPAFAVNYVPQAIAQTGLSNQYGPALGSVVFDNAFGATALANGSPAINFLGEVLYQGVTNSSVTLATHLSSTGTPLEGTITYNNVQGMFLYRPSASGNTNVYQGGQAFPPPAYGAGVSTILASEESFSFISGYRAPAVSNLFTNYILNNASQHGVSEESTRAQLYNDRPDLGHFLSPGAVRDGYRSGANVTANSDDVIGSSINGIDLKYGNVASNNLRAMNNSGAYIQGAQFSANPIGASLPAFDSSVEFNTGGVLMNSGSGATQMVTRGSDWMLDAGAGGTVRLGSSGGSAPNGVVINDNNNWVQTWNALHGTAVLAASATTGPNANNSLIFSNRSGGTRTVDGTTGVGSLSGYNIIMRGGDVAPDASGSTATGINGLLRFRQSGNTVRTNNLNHVAFNASLNNPASFPNGTAAGQNNQSQSGTLIWTDAGTGTTHLLANAYAGNAVPTVWDRTGTTSGVAFVGSTWGAAGSTSFALGSFLLDGGDRVTFATSTALVGGDAVTLAEPGAPARSQALFQIGTDNKLRMIARNGDVAPGVSAALGSPLGSADHIYFSSGVTNGFTTNGLGQIAFVASLQAATSATGAIISSGAGRNNQAIFATDVDGSLRKILQLGDAWVGADGNTHYILSIGTLNASGGQDGLARSLSDQGDLTFNISFTDTLGGTTVDGSAVVVAHVPTPGALALLGLGGLIATRRRRA